MAMCMTWRAGLNPEIKLCYVLQVNYRYFVNSKLLIRKIVVRFS